MRRPTDEPPALDNDASQPITLPGILRDLTTPTAQIDMISRSLPVAGAVLEPELPAEAIFQPAKPHHVTGVDSEITPGNDGGLDETSPLIRHATASTNLSEGGEVLFLNNISPGRFWLIYSQVLSVIFIASFDGTIMASSHPVITSYFGAANSASWLSTAFMLTATSIQPLLGRLSDALGRKPLFVGCMGVFILATVGCAAATSIEAFILARALCGIGAGGTMGLGGIIMSDFVPIERRASYQAYINVFYGLGSASGAALGGAMAEALGWRWEFGVQVPALVICLVLSHLTIPDGLGIQGENRMTVWEALAEFDTKGSIILTVTITFVTLGLNLGGNVLSWSHPFIITSLCISAVGFPIFIRAQASSRKPIMPLKLITASPHANLIYSNTIAAVISNAIFFNMPLYFQAILLESATASGLRLVLPTLVASAAGALTGFAIGWTRRLKWNIVSGTIFYIIGAICLAALHRDLPEAFYSLALVPFSIGQGQQFPGTIMSILATSSQAEQAVVTSTLMLWRSLGNVLGVAFSSLILQNALLYYLHTFVQGDEKEEIIARVRASVEAIADLEQPYREQVVLSYEASIKLVFIFCIGIACVSMLIILPIKLPRLGQKKQ